MMLVNIDPTDNYPAGEGACLEACGLIPGWVETFAAMEGKRTNSLREHLGKCYAHGGGWSNTCEYLKWEFDSKTGILTYPASDGEPAEIYHPYIRMAVGGDGVYGGRYDAVLWQYPHAWVVVEEGDDWQVARMD